MKTVKGFLVALAIFFSSVVYGQQTNTTFAQIVTNSTATGGGTNFSQVPTQYMIGQSGHQMMLALASRPAKTCDPVNNLVIGYLAIQGSYDGNSWTNISNLIPSPTYNNNNVVAGIVTVSAQGVFPLVRAEWNVFNDGPANCQVNIWYSGIVSSITNTPAVLASANTLISPSSASIGSTGVLLTEKGNRQITAISSAAIGAAAAAQVPASTTSSSFIDCITASMQATAALAAGAGTTVSLYPFGFPGSPLWSTLIGLPNGAAAGTTVTMNICGLNTPSGINKQLTIGFGSGFASVQELVSVTYGTVN